MYLRSFAVCGCQFLLLVGWVQAAYRQNDVDKVHDGQDDDADAHVEVAVGQAHQRSGEDVMGEHLGVVFALLLDVDDENLLDPEAPLDEVVPLEKAVSFPERPAFPDAVEVQPELRVVHDVLLLC
jgi:hypothetical protein